MLLLALLFSALVSIIYTLAAGLFAFEATFLFRRQLLAGFGGARGNTFRWATSWIASAFFALRASTWLTRLDVYPFLLKPASQARLSAFHNI